MYAYKIIQWKPTHTFQLNESKTFIDLLSLKLKFYSITFLSQSQNKPFCSAELENKIPRCKFKLAERTKE